MISRHTIDVPRMLVLPYIGLALWLGLGYIHGDPRRTATPSMEAPKELARTVLPGLREPMNFWGIVFLIGAVALAAGALLPEHYRRHEVLMVLLFVGGLMYCFWGAVFAWGALADSRASVNGPGVYWFAAVMHMVGVWFLNVLRVTPRLAR